MPTPDQTPPNSPAPLSPASVTTPRSDAPDPRAAPAAAAEGVKPAPEPDHQILSAHKRLNALEEDIAFLRAKLGWPVKDKS